MNLNTTTKIATLISLIAGIIISVGGFVASHKIQTLQSRLDSLNEVDKGMEISSKDYNLSPRLVSEFQLPLARTFAEDYNASMLIPSNDLMKELLSNIPKWKIRKGLMTGDACKKEGLKARQVITLTLKNIGYADATDVKVKLLKKNSPYNEPTQGWQQIIKNDTLAYCDIDPTTSGWTVVDFPVADLYGQSSPELNKKETKIILASVSGTTTFYGTILVPVEVSWTNKITKKYEVRKLMGTEAANIRSSLLGAEIGTACR